MAIQIVLGILIVSLFGYIVFLHLQLSKKNIFIESTVKKLSGIEKSRSMEEMMEFLTEIQKIAQFRSYFPDKILQENIINFIAENEKELKIYIHYTKKEDDARDITQNGFKFAESFYKTALPVTKDKLDLVIKHNSRKFFGDYLIIIGIANDIVNFYSMELEKSSIKDLFFENVLTEFLPVRNDNSDTVYQLSPRYIKGYINYRTGEIYKNSAFDPWYNSPQFAKNIELLKKK
jgi:hypothetical protein